MSDEKGEFSVCQFFKDGNYEYTRRFVSAEEAMKAFAHYTQSVAVKMGLIDRVIITDGADCVNMEWQHGQGITFPPEAVGMVAKTGIDWPGISLTPD